MHSSRPLLGNHNRLVSQSVNPFRRSSLLSPLYRLCLVFVDGLIRRSLGHDHGVCVSVVTDDVFGGGNQSRCH